MNRILLSYVLLFIFFAGGCSSGAAIQNNNSNAQPTATQTREIEKGDGQNLELQKQIEQIASAAKGRVGAKAAVIETGESVSLNADGHFPMQSVYKLPISMAILQQVDAGKLKLDQKVRVEKSDFVSPGQRSPVRDKHPNGTELTLGELIQLAVSESDGTASDVLLRVAGGPEAVMSYLKSLGIEEIIVADSEKEFARDWQIQYRNWASPNGAIELLRALHEGRGISEANQKLLLKFMVESPTGPNRLKGLLPKGTTVAHKTGTSGTRNGINAATNDIGIVTLPNGRHLAVAVFVAESPLDDAAREKVIAQITKAVWDRWSK